MGRGMLRGKIGGGRISRGRMDEGELNEGIAGGCIMSREMRGRGKR